MNSANLFPAMLVAGPPHTGKSVLSYYLSIALKESKIPFILLRAAPDGEGDWFQEVGPATAIHLRRKGAFTKAHVRRVERAILQRQLPMLVDIGGKPQGNQFRIIQACTHEILLYRTEIERRQWRGWLDKSGLLPVAELQSNLQAADTITDIGSPLRGIIGGLDRSGSQPQGPVFTTLVQRLQGIFSIDHEHLVARHLSTAPSQCTVLLIDNLAATLGVPWTKNKGYWWQPQHLEPLSRLIPRDQEVALYGRGPAWLYAAVAAATHHQGFYLFDARHYGWMRPPMVHLQSRRQNRELSFTWQREGESIRLHIHLHEAYIVPQPLHIPRLPKRCPPVILDGKAPLWCYAALARALAPHVPRLSIYDPRLPQPPVVWESPT